MKKVSLTERLLADSAPIWEGYYTHPFVCGIADGTLPVEKFRFYMIQDLLYLYDYARVFAMGVVKSRDPETMRVFARYVHQILDGEMNIHKAYMRRLEIDEEKAAKSPVSLSNHSYTAYMRAIAAEEGPAEIAAAILSCAVSYEYIAKHIMEQHPDADKHPFYGEWVEGYASARYAEENRALEKLIEKLAEGYTDAQIDHLSEVFCNCSRYERMFWDMAWEMAL